MFTLDHVSYHRVKLGEDNFGALANSKVEVLLHKLDSKHGNVDSIIGRGEMNFNKIFLSQNFFYVENVDIHNYIAPEPKEPEEKITKFGKKAPFTKQAQKQPKKKEGIDFSYKIGNLHLSCELMNTNIEKQQLNQVKVKEEVENFVKEERVVENVYEEYKLECDEILNLFLIVTNYKPVKFS
jgi:hypothetical protein